MFLRLKNPPARCCRRPHAGRRRHGRGFTLIEMVAAIVVAGIIFSFGSVMLGNIFRGYSLKRDVADADWQAKVALERMARELRAVRLATATGLDIASAAQVRFVDSDGNGVCFYHDAAANRIMRSADGPATACGATGPRVLADNITLLAFTYWKNDGAAAAVAGDVYYITVAITVAKGAHSSSYRTNVRPRNF